MNLNQPYASQMPLPTLIHFSFLVILHYTSISALLSLLYLAAVHPSCISISFIPQLGYSKDENMMMMMINKWSK